MTEFIRGDIFQADAEAIVNAVNCVGIMGSGIAAQFRRAYPMNFVAYQQACKRHEVRPGKMLITETGRPCNPRWIVNFPTKRHWRNPSKLNDIEIGLNALVTDILQLGARSLAVPALGCGLGGLDWLIVRSRMERVLEGMRGVRVTVFEP